MGKQAVAEKLEKSVIDRVRGLLALLPNSITRENGGMFVTVCEKAEVITTDAFTEAESLGCRDFFSGWRRVLTPWWKGSYDKWEYAYGEGFTWKQFIDYILECNCNTVDIKKEQDVPTIFFAGKDGKNQFCIELSKED